jgi:colicin import membrane protein
MFAAGALALGVHVLFVLLLVFGVSWQTQHPAPVMVDLWESLPKQAAPVVPPPRPRPEPVKTPEPVKAVPVPKPVEKAPPPIKAPDIALERKKAEAERLKQQQIEEKTRAEAVRKAHEKQLAEQKKRELLRQMEEEDLMRRMADEEAANTARQAQLAEARAAASKRQAEVARIAKQNGDLISAKVRGNTRLPDNLKGTLEVRLLVKLLPTGEVVSVQVSKSSGNVAYDNAVWRAIEKSSPLPLPADREARDRFVPEFTLIHSP